MISPYWIITPDGGRWENTVAALPPGTYTITFAPLSGLFAPVPQNVSILNGTVTMAQANYAPLLNMFSSGGNVVLTWPTNIAGFSLESATNLTSGAWNLVAPIPVVINGLNTVTNPVSGGQMFFRLSE